MIKIRMSIRCVRFYASKSSLSLSIKNPKSLYNVDSNFSNSLDTALGDLYSKMLNKEFTKSSWYHMRTLLKEQLENHEPNDKVPTLSTLLSNDPSQLVPLLHHKDSPSFEPYFRGKDKTVSILERYIPKREFEESIANIDISSPKDWFPQARLMKRKIIMHVGPTNSGKTYNALQKLKTAKSGYYAGPLRLLAREIFERFHKEGTRCNLLTGEEVINDLDNLGRIANITSGTVEMISTTKEYDVVVLDEIQMIADPERGWAWTNALLGAKAREIHLCGELSAVPLVEKICQSTGDILEINQYQRLGTLEVMKNPVGSFNDLKMGDCIVAFSKKKILGLKVKIEKETGKKVAVIYGALPPETRIQQAELFNSGKAEVLVASDAVGMGLNLSINRVIFSTDSKFNGMEMIPLTDSNFKQIGGRAGRFKQGRERNTGFVTALDMGSLRNVAKGMSAPVKKLEKAVIWPTDTIWAKYATRFPPKTPLSEILETFDQEVSNSKLFALPNVVGKLEVTAQLEGRPILLADQLRLTTAPIKNDPIILNAFGQFLDTIGHHLTKPLYEYILPFHTLDDRSRGDLETYESLHKVIMLFFWLSNRYPHYFVDRTSALQMKGKCEEKIMKELDNMRKNPYLKRGPPVHRRRF